MKEAGINAKQAGERGISAKSVKKVTEVGLFSSMPLGLYTDRAIQQLSLSKFKG